MSLAIIAITQIMEDEEREADHIAHSSEMVKNKKERIMDSKELRAAVVAKFDAKSVEFGSLKSGAEAFCVGILVDCKDILDQIPDAKTLFNIIVDEVDDRVNTGAFDVIDGLLVKGIFEKFCDTPKLEKWFADIKGKAVEIINSNIPKA